MREFLRDDSGSSAVEFVLVGILLTALTLGVLQLALVVYLRNLTHDAAVEGAYHAALADVAVSAGADRAVSVIERTVGEGFVASADARIDGSGSSEAVVVTVVATLPILGIWGVPEGWEVTAHAPRERLEG